MAAVAKKDTKDVKLYNYAWSGKDKSGKVVKGEVRAPGDHVVMATLRRQGIQVSSVKKVSQRGGKKITDKDITIFTRQLATMLRASLADPKIQSLCKSDGLNFRIREIVTGVEKALVSAK